MRKSIVMIILLYCVLHPGTGLPLVPPRRNVPEEYRALFIFAASSVVIPPGALGSIAFVESGFDPAAVSPLRENGQRDLRMFQHLLYRRVQIS
jgi:hypothetical protein